MKKLPIKILTISVLAGFIGACASPAYEYRKDSVVTEISVPLNKTVTAGKTGLSIRFDKIESDSRCPINARCVWAGVAVVKATVRNNKGESKLLSLSTINYEAFNQKEKAFGRDIELLSLKPNRVAGQTGKPEINPPTITLKID